MRRIGACWSIPASLLLPTILGVGWVDKSDLSPLTRERYGEIIESHLIPTLGAVELKKLKPADVNACLGSMREGKRGIRGARTIIHSYRVLQAALKTAVRHDLVAHNVADHVEPPKTKKPTVPNLKANDVPTVLEALKGNRIYPVVALALSTGAPRSELLALKWSNVDLKHGTLKIEHSLEQTKAGLRTQSAQD